MILTHFNDYGFYEGWRVASNVNKLDYIFAAEQCGNYHVVANDMAGNSSRKDFTVKIDKTSPNIKNINITSTISANAFDNSNSFQSGIKSVILYDSNNNVVSQNVVDDKYSYNPYWSGGVDYGRVFNLAYYRDNNSDLSAWIGNDWPTYFWHYTNYGIYEGRAGSPYFDMNTYKNQNIDIFNAFGNANWNALIHFNTYGFYEGWRVANDINVLNYTFPIEQRGNYYITVTDMAGNTTRNNFGLNNYIVKFDGNGGSGIMSDIINNNPTINLPTHTYLKENTAGNSKFLGWNTDSKTKMPLYMENDSITITTEVTEVTLYAIWDDCPIISGTDSYYTLEDAKSGKLSEEDLLKDVSVTDDWDSDFEKTLKIVNYNPYDFKQFTSDGSMVVKYQVTDSGGNTSYTTNIVYIVDTNPDVVQKNQYVRFINEDYYQKTSTDGGLGENSIWKTNVAYLGILEKAMLNRKSLVEEIGSMNAFGFNYSYAKPGSISQNHIYQSWSFDSDEIEKVKEYINTHGFGNIQEATALKNFLIEFGDCKK